MEMVMSWLRNTSTYYNIVVSIRADRKLKPVEPRRFSRKTRSAANTNHAEPRERIRADPRDS